MATGLFSKIIKGALIGGGTLLSILSGSALIPVGAALITAGAALPIGNGTTCDPYSAGSQNMLEAWNMSGAMSNAGQNYSSFSGITTLIKNNLPIVLSGVALVLFLMFRRKKR